MPPPQDADPAPSIDARAHLTDEVATFVIQHRRGIVGWISFVVLAGLLYMGLLVRGLGVDPLAPDDSPPGLVADP